MRVKKLEIIGFKSFAKKTTIHFEPGVTAIVGPNGSGKCVHGSSRVILAGGQVMPIQDLVDSALQQSTWTERWDDGFCTYDNPDRHEVLSLNPVSLKVEARPITAFIKRTSPATLYRFVTKTGRQLIATGYHPLFTLEHGSLKTLLADQLRIGMRIAIPRRLPVIETNNQLDNVAVFQRFERSDSVYVPYSPALEQWVGDLSESGGSLTALAKSAAVQREHVATVRQGQALNLATVSQLQQWSQTPPGEPIGTTLQGSRGGLGAMRVPQRVTPALARFLGYCISEGRNTSANQVWFVNSDPALVDDFCRCVTETFGLRPRALSYKPTTKDVIVFSHALCQYLEKGFQLAIDQPSADKRVPEALFRSSDDCVTAFLSALFEGDGHVSVRRGASGRKTLAYVEYTTASRRLADDVCLLLARFGIVGRVAVKWKAATNTRQRTKRPYCSVFVYGVDQLKILANLLEFRGEKRQALARLRALDQAPNPNDDVVPGVTPLVKVLVQQAGIPLKRHRGVFPTLAAYYEQRCEATRPGLKRALDAISALGQWTPDIAVACDTLRTLATSDLYWDEIVAIDPVPGEEWVYDLAVEGHHNFVADGVIVHNSNIVDSIRWVLGEHNPRDVRAPRLEDVIFNGTDRVAPLSMAEVNLTIDNEHGLLPISFSEVTITRRAYRSGESECFINQSPCRLKDIHELFLGTGLGGGTYAIIEQGHIDLILSSKPEERRVVFEEASGVAKYLAKKQETTRRLDETEEHLVRIADIIAEVRRQVAALERAANKARQYKSQWEQLKGLELRLAVDELSVGETRYNALEQALATLDAQRAALEAEKQGHVSSLEGFNAAVSAVQQKLQELRTTVVECASQMEQHESQRTLKTRWIEELTAQAQQLEAEAAQLRSRAGQLDAQLSRVAGGESEIRAQLAAVKEQFSQGDGALAALETTLQTALNALSVAKAQLFEAASDASQQRNHVGEMTSRLQGLEAQLARLEESRAQQAAQIKEWSRRRDAIQHERDAFQIQHEEIQRRIDGAARSLDAAVARRHELTDRVHQLRDRLANERARVALLEDLWRRYAGFPDTVKALLGQSIDGLIGPLVDLLQAAAGYEALVEAALGPLADALVVRDRDTLARCQEVLSAQQLDGCRFLVLSDCPAQVAAMERPAVQEKVTGAVKQYVHAEPAYQPLVDWILNDSWVVDDLERLLRERSLPQGRLVSARGDRWDRRSWRFGTSRPAAQGRLGRKQQWDDARGRLQTREQEFAELDAQAKEAEDAWQSLLREQESAKGELAPVAPSVLKLEHHLSQLMHQIQQLEQERAARELETQELTAQREEHRAALATAQQSAQEAEVRQQTIERSLADAQGARETAGQRTQQLMIARAQVEATLRSLTERLQALDTRRQELESDRRHLAQQMDAKTIQRQEALQRSNDLAQQQLTHQERSKALQEERGRLEAEASAVSQAVREEETKRDQVLPHLLAVEERLSALTRQIHEQSQQLSERTFRRSRLIERLRELYQIDDATLEAQLHAEAAPLTDEQRASMSGEVQKLRARLEGIGPVSLGSVEEYDELKRRHEFLQTQQQDLIQARDDLKASITQINRTARTQFRETFEKIRQEFKGYFSRLFDGGEADLILMDPEDVLESGIDIIARPPGKRLQSISLLSGGERALTAVTLLFALFKVRPSPFCILDEIDAPLDEANVDRFTRVLEEFLSLSQFILITHNKKTITKADSLYGVTMQEPGISKILSAKLTAAEPAPASPNPVSASPR